MSRRYSPSSSRKKALHRAWTDFRLLARTIRGQSAFLKSVGTNSAMDVPQAWLEQIEQLRLALEDLKDQVEARAAEVPEGAHPAVLRDRDHVLDSMEAEYRALFEELFGGIKHVQSLLNDPLRTATTFGGSFLDYLSVGADFLKVLAAKRNSKKKRG
ncbi:MAG: hypothetical protein AB8G99_02415 [Planctomycetaceae bacterium]